LHFIVERACKSSADQKLESLILKKLSYSFPADFLSHAGVKDFNVAVIDVAVSYPDAISISARFILEPLQKFRAFRRQGKRDRNHLICLAQMFPVNRVSLLI